MIDISVRGIDQLKVFLSKIPVELRKLAVSEATKYLVGNSDHGLKHMVAYKYVSRKSAYGQTFKSDKQRRYVMAMIKSGEITPGRENRTGAISAGWTSTVTGGGYGSKISNNAPGAKWVYGDDTQAKQLGMVGHRKMSEVISTNIDGAMLAVRQAITRWINSNNK